MAEFYINLTEVKRISRNMDIVGNAIGNAKQRVNAASNGIQRIGLGDLSINFDILEQELATNKIKIENLTTSLENVVAVFTKAEDGLVNDKISLIESIVDLFGDKSDGHSGVPMKISTNPSSNADGNQEYVSPSGTSYVIGEATQPEYVYDDDFPYDPNAVATDEDRKNYKKWSRNAWLADNFGWLKDISDAGDVYDHYMNGNGEDFEINFEGAYKQDSNVKAAVDYYVNDLQHTVDQMIANGQQPPFSITGDLIPINGDYYPNTENWQKTIGAYNMWISADVSIDTKGNIVMETTVHEIDRYNFNRGQQDIATGTPDDINGRFEELGWAHSFTTTGEMDLNVSWVPGDVPDADSANYGGGR